jgi:hypothetical protein
MRDFAGRRNVLGKAGSYELISNLSAKAAHEGLANRLAELT